MAKDDETTTTTTTETPEQVAEREAAEREAELAQSKGEAVSGERELDEANDPLLGDDMPEDALEAREATLAAAKGDALANHAASN